MSILIRGVSMPKMPEKMEQGQEVPYVDVRVFADGDAVISTGVRPYYKKYQAIELPPHGRLIDADAIMDGWMNLREATKYGNKTKEELEHSYSTMMMYEIADAIEDAPTIIPADPEGGSDG